MALGDRIHQVRAESGLSQERIAARAGLSRYTFQRLEKGVGAPGSAANPTLATLMSVADALGVTIAALLPDQQLAPSPQSQSPQSQSPQSQSRRSHAPGAPEGVRTQVSEPQAAPVEMSGSLATGDTGLGRRGGRVPLRGGRRTRLPVQDNFAEDD